MTNMITKEHIAALINSSAITTAKLGNKTTCVTAILPCGFEIVATSACVDPRNYNQQIGREICIKRIEDKLWELEGYMLQTKLYLAGPIGDCDSAGSTGDGFAV